MYNVLYMPVWLYLKENIKVINVYEYLGTNIHHLSEKLILRQNEIILQLTYLGTSKKFSSDTLTCVYLRFIKTYINCLKY